MFNISDRSRADITPNALLALVIHQTIFTSCNGLSNIFCALHTIKGAAETAALALQLSEFDQPVTSTVSITETLRYFAPNSRQNLIIFTSVKNLTLHILIVSHAFKLWASVE